MLYAVIHEEKTNYSYPDFDRLWKNLVSEMFEDFILFFAPELYDQIDFSKSPKFLQDELYQELITDKYYNRMPVQIIKAPLLNGKEKWILVHIELKDRVNDEFRKRMFHYFYRIYDQYDQEIYAIALVTNSKSYTKQDYYDYHYYGTSLIYKYNVFNFKEQKMEKLLQSSNPFAVAVLAGIYAIEAKGDFFKKSSFKNRLMHQLSKRLSTEYKNTRQSLFAFIDYLL